MRMHSHSYWLVIFVQPIAAECRRGRGGKLSRILWKKTICNELLVCNAKQSLYVENCMTPPVNDTVHCPEEDGSALVVEDDHHRGLNLLWLINYLLYWLMNYYLIADTVEDLRFLLSPFPMQCILIGSQISLWPFKSVCRMVGRSVGRLVRSDGLS